MQLCGQSVSDTNRLRKDHLLKDEEAGRWENINQAWREETEVWEAEPGRSKLCWKGLIAGCDEAGFITLVMGRERLQVEAATETTPPPPPTCMCRIKWLNMTKDSIWKMSLFLNEFLLSFKARKRDTYCTFSSFELHFAAVFFQQPQNNLTFLGFILNQQNVWVCFT